MGWFSILLLVFIGLNGVQNIILAYILRNIASKMGRKANYLTRMTSDQVFLYSKMKKEKDTILAKKRKLLYYSIFTSLFQIVLVILLFLSLIF